MATVSLCQLCLDVDNILGFAGLVKVFLSAGRVNPLPLDNSPQLILRIAKLNFRPRKCLGWKTPCEVALNQVLHLT